MLSFLVCHKEGNRFSPSRKRAEEALLAGLKEAGRLLPRPWSTRTKPSRSKLAQGSGLVRRGWLSVFATLAIGCVWLAAPLHAQFVYVTNAGGSVSAYSIAADGFLVPVPGSPFAAEREPNSVAVDPTGKFAYVANAGDANNVSAYRIAADGALTQVPGSPFAAGSRPVSVAVDPTGKFAYVANNLENNASAYSIAANGALTQVPGSPFATGSRPVSMAVDPTGKFAYVANSGGNNVSAYRIAGNGALLPVPGSPFAAGGVPLSMAVDPTGKFAYLAHAGVNTGWAYHIAANGELTPVLGSSPFPTGSFPVSVAMGPTGKFFYVVTRGSSTGSRGGVSVNLIAAGGFVVPIGHFATGIQPVSMAVDPTGKFAYVANQIGDIHSLDGSLSAYRIAANGDLTPVPGSPFAARFGTTSVAITPLVPFASSLAELEIAKDRFDLKESFTLGTNSNGINPVKENVTLQIGAFSVMIPAGSFFKLIEGGYAFEGVINGVSFAVQILPLGNNIFTFRAVGTDVDLTGLTKPVTVVLTIGINSGATTVIIPSF
jgi:6-phosphogluconolactonase